MLLELQNRTNIQILTFGIVLPDVFKTSWKKRNCYAKEVLNTSSRHFLRSLSRRLEDQRMFSEKEITVYFYYFFLEVIEISVCFYISQKYNWFPIFNFFQNYFAAAKFSEKKDLNYWKNYQQSWELNFNQLL